MKLLLITTFSVLNIGNYYLYKVYVLISYFKIVDKTLVCAVVLSPNDLLTNEHEPFQLLDLFRKAIIEYYIYSEKGK